MPSSPPSRTRRRVKYFTIAVLALWDWDRRITRVRGQPGLSKNKTLSQKTERKTYILEIFFRKFFNFGKYNDHFYVSVHTHACTSVMNPFTVPLTIIITSSYNMYSENSFLRRKSKIKAIWVGKKDSSAIYNSKKTKILHFYILRFCGDLCF